MGKAKLAHLSAEDILSLNVDVERVIALGRQKPGWTASCVKRFVDAMAPRFKYASMNGRVDVHGHPMVRIHCEQWEVSVAEGTNYAKLREAFGWFVHIPDPPLASMWAFTPPLTSDAPKRALGHTWDIAVMHARKQQRRTVQRTEASNG
jgi:hypothetical protein